MQTADRIDIVIADDHEIFRDGLKLMLEKSGQINVIGEAANGYELLEVTERMQPKVVITDIKMPLMDGVEATKQLKIKHPGMGIIALSMFDEEQLILEMLEAEALGYLLKNSDKEEIIQAISTVHMNEPYYCKHTSGKLAKLIAYSRNDHQRKMKEAEFTDSNT